LGWHELAGSPVTVAAAAAAERGIPVVGICGRTEAGRRETMAAGFSGAYAVASSLGQWSAFAVDPAGALASRAEAVARTWSPQEQLGGPHLGDVP
ncbi:MAG: glycerate kinase, partial [Candidatus Phosphoribacter sp.]